MLRRLAVANAHHNRNAKFRAVGSPTVDKHIEEALAAPSHEKALEAWKKVQWDGTTGPESEKGDLPYIWLVTIDHTYYVKDDLDIPEQPLHPHGHGWPVICNLNEWKRK